MVQLLTALSPALVALVTAIATWMSNAGSWSRFEKLLGVYDKLPSAARPEVDRIISLRLRSLQSRYPRWTAMWAWALVALLIGFSGLIYWLHVFRYALEPMSGEYRETLAGWGSLVRFAAWVTGCLSLISLIGLTSGIIAGLRQPNLGLLRPSVPSLPLVEQEALPID